MDKIIEALSKALPEEQVKEVSAAIEKMVADAVKEATAKMEAEYNTKLEGAYEELSKEAKDGETVATEGYQQAYAIIQDMRNRLETQRAEFEKFMEEEYEQAFQMLKTEQAKKETVETELYSEYDKKLAEMKEFMIDKLDQFLQIKGKEIYEEARRDILNDPRLVEHKVTLSKIVDTVADYISDDDYALATNTKLSEAQKAIDELKGQVKLLESRNIRMSSENTKLNEAVRQSQQTINEQTQTASKTEKNEREEKASKVEGRGKKSVEPVEVIKETNTETKPADEGDNTLIESLKPEEMAAWTTLAGIKK